jgi:membrane-bound lytic murein transglycosylase D
MYMSKTMAVALFMFVAVTVIASSKANAEINQARLTDTIQNSDPDSSPRNLLFKHRLDSIQKTVPLTYNKYVQDYIDIYMARAAQIGRVLGLSNYYFPIYEKAFKENNVPEEIKFVSIVESSLNPHAVSRVGATGLWQFMYSTAKVYGLTMDNYVDERKDPVSASFAAAHYFRNAFEEFGDWLLAIAAYNCGTKAVERAIAKAGGVKDFWTIRPYLPLETRNYIPAFIATTYIMKYYSSHAISPVPADFPLVTDLIQVNRFVSLASIAKATEVDLNKLYLLNPSYKKQVINGTPEIPKTLVIPSLNKDAYTGLYDVLNNPFDQEFKITQASPKSVSRHSANTSTYHKVKTGENLSIIAEKYHVEVQELKAWNKLKSMVIHPGQMLKVNFPKV